MNKKLIYSLAIAGAVIVGGVAYANASDKEELGQRFGRTAMIEDKAKLFGTSADELSQELDSGKTMHEIAEEQGIDHDEMYAHIRESKEKRFNQLIADGKITQEQADEKLQLMQERHDNGETGPHEGKMKGSGNGLGLGKAMDR